MPTPTDAKAVDLGSQPDSADFLFGPGPGSVPTMKLRIFGSSVRFRMRPPEVAAWLESGTVSDGVRIGPRDGDRWSYRLEVTPAADWDVAVESGHWVVSVPRSAARAWADSDLVALEHLTPWGTRITIEKDLPRRTR